jgi:hypothetical protein
MGAEMIHTRRQYAIDNSGDGGKGGQLVALRQAIVRLLPLAQASADEIDYASQLWPSGLSYDELKTFAEVCATAADALERETARVQALERQLQTERAAQMQLRARVETAIAEDQQT